MNIVPESIIHWQMGGGGCYPTVIFIISVSAHSRAVEGATPNFYLELLKVDIKLRMFFERADKKKV